MKNHFSRYNLIYAIVIAICTTVTNVVFMLESDMSNNLENLNKGIPPSYDYPQIVT